MGQELQRSVFLSASMLMRHPCHNRKNPAPDERRDQHNGRPRSSHERTGFGIVQDFFGGEH